MWTDNVFKHVLITASLIRLIENCLTGWAHNVHFGFCYKMVENPKLSWRSAERYCNGLHVHASLSDLWNYREQTNISDLVFNNSRHKFAWLGGRRLNDEWRWTDYTRLFEGQLCWILGKSSQYCGLNNAAKVAWSGKTLCLQIRNDGLLDGVSCQTELPFICKIKDDIHVTCANSPSSTPDPHTTPSTVIILPCVLVPLFLFTVVATVVFFHFRRKRQASSLNQPMVEDRYENLRELSSNNDHVYVHLRTKREGDQESPCVDSTSLPVSTNHVYSVADHEYASVYFPSNTYMSFKR